MFDWDKPTTMLLGRYQPWHDGHTALFKRAHEKTGQVCIMIRHTFESNESNPYPFERVRDNIKHGLEQAGFEYYHDYVIMKVPNITNITYGRDVGYAIEQEHFDEEIEAISATKIRESSEE